MITNKNLDRYFWVKDVNTTCNTLNSCFFWPGSYQALYELVLRKKPNVKHLRIFGSIFYILKDRENIDKFEAKIDVGMFLGYSNNSGAYKVYNLRTSIVIESIIVVIDDYGGVKIVESSDSDVFDSQGSSKGIFIDNDEILIVT